MKVINGIYKVSVALVFIFMAVMGIVMFMQVFSRSFLSYSFRWAEELARILLVWTTFIGGSVAFRDKALAAFDMLEIKLKGKFKTMHNILMQILILIFCSAVFYYGVQLMFQPIVFNQTSPTLKIPMYFLYAAVPLGMALIILYSIVYLFELAKRNKTQTEETTEVKS